MRSFVALAATVAVAVVGACGADTGGEFVSRRAEPWGAPAVEFFDSLVDAFDEDDEFQFAAHFAGGGTLDLRAVNGGLWSDPTDIAAALRDESLGRWHVRPGIGLDVDDPQVFLSVDGAVARYDGHGGPRDLRLSWVQLYSIGADARLASRVYAAAFPEDPTFGAHLPGFLELIARYLEAWSTGDAEALADIYAEDAYIRDGATARTWAVPEEIGDLVEHTERVELGPHPGFFSYFDGSSRRGEIIVLVQTSGDCPMLEARRWEMTQDYRIAWDTRYAHVPSVQRCQNGLDDGWWSDFEPRPPTDRLNAQTHLIEGRNVELVNAEAGHVRLSEWLLGRFADGDVGIPAVSGIWFPPSLDCDGEGSRARQVDTRYGGGHSITLCMNGDQLVPDTLQRTWSQRAVRDGLHELAHVWMYDRLGDRVRSEFVERTGLAAWRDEALAWGELGVEHAAETIAWGLAGDEHATYSLEPAPACDELAARFRLLTGTLPLTVCRETP